MTEEKQQQIRNSTVIYSKGKLECIKIFKQWRNSDYADERKIKLVIKLFYPQFQNIILQR